MNRTKKFFYNSLSTAILQIFVFLSGFIVPRFMLQYYGSDTNGLVSSINQFITYFRLVEAGLASASVYALYKPLADKNQKAINSVLSASKNFYQKTGAIFSAAILVFAVAYSFLVDSESLSRLNVGLLVVVLASASAFDFFAMAKYRVLLTADQKVYVLSIANIIATILNIVIIAVLATLRVNIVIVKLAALANIIVRTLILYIFTKRHYKALDYKAEPDNAALNKRWDALFINLANAVQVGAPIIIVTFMLSLKQVSVFSVYNMVVTGIMGILGIFTSGLSASFGEVISKGNDDILKKSYTEFQFLYYKIIAFFYACTAILITPFVSVYTRGIHDVNYVLPLFGILMTLRGLVNNLRTPQGMMITSAGKFKEIKPQVIVQLVLAIVLGVGLGFAWGLEGVIIGVIISNLYRCVVITLYANKNVTKTKLRQTLRQILLLLATIGLIYLPFIFIKVNAKSYLEWLVWAICVSCYALLVTVAVALLTDCKLAVRTVQRLKITFNIRSKTPKKENLPPENDNTVTDSEKIEEEPAEGEQHE